MNILKKFIMVVMALLWLGISLLVSDDRVDIDSVPWTDACYCWTQTGRRLPVFNQNLMGNKLSIGGVKYDRGIAGHTPFSVVYNLSGKALSFSATIGIDDDAHPRDSKKVTSASVDVVILVDRQEVLRKTVIMGDKGIPIKVNLRGKQQIELIGTYKTGFIKQRVDFANACFVVKNKAEFLKNAMEWQKKVKTQLFRKVCYPGAPAWKRVQVRKISYRNWKHAYKLSNDKCSIIVVPEYGGRILSFALNGSGNVLFQGKDPTPANLYKRGCAISGGGNFSRPQPKVYFNSIDPILAFGEYAIEFPVEGEVVMTSAKSWYFGLQYIYRIKLHPTEAKVSITTSHKNIALYPHQAGVWSLTRLDTAKASMLYMPKEMKNPYRPFEFKPVELLKQVELKNNCNFDIFQIMPSLLEKKKCYLEWKNFPAVNTMKVLMNDKIKSSIRSQKDNARRTFFIKTFDYQIAMNPFMTKIYPAHFYLCKSFIEVETHGPVKMLQPDKAVSWHEKWILKEGDNCDIP